MANQYIDADGKRKRTKDENVYAGHEKEYKQKWYIDNKERMQKLQKERYHRNKTRLLMLSRIYQAEHPEAVRRYKRTNKDRVRFGGIRQDILERDKFVCQVCDSDNQLVIHHIDETTNRKPNQIANNDPTNLITLCRSCHLKVHKYKLKI